MMIEVRYSCVACGLVDATCQVLSRDSKQDVFEWFKVVVVPALYEHHGRLRNCQSKNLTNVRVPFTDASIIGGPPGQARRTT